MPKIEIPNPPEVEEALKALLKRDDAEARRLLRFLNMPDLAKHFKIYAIDMIGSGRSDKIDFSELDFEKDLVDTTAEFIKLKELDNFHAVDTSIGGWVALKIALRNIGMQKLIISDTVGMSSHVKPSDKMIGIYIIANILSKTIFNPNRKNKKLEKLADERRQQEDDQVSVGCRRDSIFAEKTADPDRVDGPVGRLEN